MMSSPESRLRPEDETPLKGDGMRAAHPKESDSSQAPASAQERTGSLLAAEKRTLEMIANGASLSEVLNDLCTAIDAHAPAAVSMVCLMDVDGKQLLPGAGPHVPAAFTTAITPWPIGPNRGSCGTAAFTKQRVVIPDISNDPRWPDEARDLALTHGFCAAWSEPLISKDGDVLGTFCVSYAEPRTPNRRDLELINEAGHIALIAIELERSHRALKNALVGIKNSEDRLRTIIDTIPALAWSARPDGSAEFFNRRWLDYAGLSAEEASDWGWTVALHREDRARLTDYWRRLLASGEAGEIEARLRRFDGGFRWFLFRASPWRDGSGQVVKWYGTNTDIEERKRAEEALRSNEQSLHRCPGNYSDQPRFVGRDRSGNIPGRSVLQVERLPDPGAASAETERRHSDAGRVLRKAVCRQNGKANPEDRQAHAGTMPGIPLAGQYSRAAKYHREIRDPLWSL